jgi:hypothetical protein
MALSKMLSKTGLIDAVAFLIGGALSGILFSFLPLPSIVTVLIGFALVVVGFTIDGYFGAFLIGVGAISASGITGLVKGVFGQKS